MRSLDRLLWWGWRQQHAFRQQWSAVELRDGLRYIWGKPTLAALIGLAAVPTVLAMPFQQMLPVFATDGAGARRNGMYVIANYHYLHGFRYDEVNAELALETDAAS